jgi:hypothetical protein
MDVPKYTYPKILTLRRANFFSRWINDTIGDQSMMPDTPVPVAIQESTTERVTQKVTAPTGMILLIQTKYSKKSSPFT